MKKAINTFLIILMFNLVANAQVSSFMYVKVAPENQAEFERLETTYWSQVAKKGIDEGKMIAWGLMRKVGMAGSDANYILVNIFENFQDASNAMSIYDPSVIDMEWKDIDTNNIKETLALHYYQIEDVIEGPSKFNIHNYATPKNLAGFVEENLNLWKPLIQDNIKKKRTKQTNWGIGTKVYPKGSDAGFSVFTRDGYETLADAMEALSFKATYPDFFNDVMGKTKMNEYNPNGFQHQIIFENIKWVN
jgi:hypothetical protein